VCCLSRNPMFSAASLYAKERSVSDFYLLVMEAKKLVFKSLDSHVELSTRPASGRGTCSRNSGKVHT